MTEPSLDLKGMIATAMDGMKTIKMSPGWWNSFNYQETFKFDDEDLINFAKSAMLAKSLTSEEVVYTNQLTEGTKKNFKYCYKTLADACDMRLVYVSLNPERAFYVTETGACWIAFGQSSELDKGYPIKCKLVNSSYENINDMKTKIGLHLDLRRTS